MNIESWLARAAASLAFAATCAGVAAQQPPAAAEASMTDWGMSLGACRVPQT